MIVKQEPLPIYIFRYLIWIAMLAFMAMLYWSSDLLEQDMHQVQARLEEVQQTLRALQMQGGPITPNAQKDALHALPATSAYVDERYENLLTIDPFYARTLPEKLLPKNFVPWGTFCDDTLGKPENLHPFSLWGTVKSFQQLCLASLAKPHFGQYESFAPCLAFKMEMRPSAHSELPEFWIHLRRDVYWQPINPVTLPSGMKIASHFLKKHPVTAHDFKFWLDAARNPYVGQKGASAAAQQMQDLESLEILDDYTFILRWKGQRVALDGKETLCIPYRAKLLSFFLEPLPCFVYQYFPDGTKIVDDDSDPETYRTHSVWAQNFTEHWAKNIIPSCGAYVFGGMSDEALTFQRNQSYFDPLEALVAERRYTFRESLDAFWQDFQTQKIPSYTVRPEKLMEYEAFLKSPTYLQQTEQGQTIKELDYAQGAFAYIGWNEATPYFSSQKVRLAMTLAIDRKRIIEQNLNGMGQEITASLPFYSPAYDKSLQPWPYNPHEARRLLQEEGWYDSDGDGILDKEIQGRKVPFRFALTYYVKSLTGKSICEYIASALKQIGIDCLLNGVDITDLSQAMDDKNFDALMAAWSYSAPPEDPRQLWHSAGAKEKGSSNFIGFNNPQVDKIIEALDYEYDTQKRLTLYHQFHRILHEEQPYLFLYVPRMKLLYRDILGNVFIPSQEQDLVPGAVVSEPIQSIFYLKRLAS